MRLSKVLLVLVTCCVAVACGETTADSDNTRQPTITRIKLRAEGDDRSTVLDYAAAYQNGDAA
jgi:hypothetical protein